MVVKFNTLLLFYGENINYKYGRDQQQETYSAKEQIENEVASGVSLDALLGEK